MKFGYLIFRNISKFVAARCQIMKAKNAPNAISTGAPLLTPLGELTALPQTLLMHLRGPTSKEIEGNSWEREDVELTSYESIQTILCV